MTTIAAEFDMQPYELRAYADDMLPYSGDTATDVDEVPAEAEAFIRASLAQDGSSDED